MTYRAEDRRTKRRRSRPTEEAPASSAGGVQAREAIPERAGRAGRAEGEAAAPSRPSTGRLDSSGFLPATAEEIRARGWDQADVVLVSGDAYIDHPSFAAAILGRWLEAHGFRVAILAQPDWRSAEPWRALGPPRLFYGVSAGNMDSMINHYTANRKRRNADAYSPDGRIGLRPDRASAVYAQRCREAWKGVPVILGGVEASLRRVAHYDYWSDKVWPTILATSKADLLLYGMGERGILEAAQRLARAESVRDLRDMPGAAYLLGKAEALEGLPKQAWPEGDVELPDFDAVCAEPRAFSEMTRLVHRETNPLNARRVVQVHGDRTLVVNPPAQPLETELMDRLHGLPYRRVPHPMYGGAHFPAWETIKESVQIMRGCFGGCTFCSITLHQGRTIQSRSHESIIGEVRAIAARDDFSGHISDLGGPTANMYRMRCTDPEVERVCKRLSCIHPTVCKRLDTSHAPTLELMRDARAVPGVKSVKIASGIRMDLARDEPEYLEELARHHVGGHLKVAPEHSSDKVLGVMKKPSKKSFEEFAERFEAASARAGKEQYLVPYFIASHPGSGVDEMIELAVFLKQRGYRPRQVQDFIPAPMDIATSIYHTGLSPFTGKPVAVAKGLRDRRVQRALLQFFAPENYFVVRDALVAAGRRDLIGSGPDCLIPARPPKEASRSGADGAGPEKRASGGYRHASRTRGRERSRP